MDQRTTEEYAFELVDLFGQGAETVAGKNRVLALSRSDHEMVEHWKNVKLLIAGLSDTHKK